MRAQIVNLLHKKYFLLQLKMVVSMVILAALLDIYALSLVKSPSGLKSLCESLYSDGILSQ